MNQAAILKRLKIVGETTAFFGALGAATGMLGTIYSGLVSNPLIAVLTTVGSGLLGSSIGTLINRAPSLEDLTPQHQYWVNTPSAYFTLASSVSVFGGVSLNYLLRGLTNFSSVSVPEQVTVGLVGSALLTIGMFCLSPPLNPRNTLVSTISSEPGAVMPRLR